MSLWYKGPDLHLRCATSHCKPYFHTIYCFLILWRLVLAVCQQVLPGPELALKATLGSNRKQRQEAEGLLQAATSDVLHLLNMLKAVAPLLTGMLLSVQVRTSMKFYFMLSILLAPILVEMDSWAKNF